MIVHLIQYRIISKGKPTTPWYFCNTAPIENKHEQDDRQKRLAGEFSVDPETQRGEEFRVVEAEISKTECEKGNGK